MRYSGLLTKNPVDRDWEVTLLNPRPFELGELADYVDLETKPKKTENEKNEVSGLGRNCMMFDVVRKWAYKAIRACLKGGYDSWYQKVLNMSLSANSAFLDPLPYSEVKATAKSIAKWVWRNHTSAEFHAWFGAKQSNRAKIGVIKGNVSKGGKARSQQYSDMRQEALKLHIMGVKQKQMATQLNISDRTIRNWLKEWKVQS